MKTLIDFSPGVFYELGDGFFLPIQDIKAQTDLEVGQKLSLNCMFEVYFVNLNNHRCGFYFTTRFTVVNGGSHLLTHLVNKGEAEDVETLLRDDNLVIYNYPNRGTLAISPLVNEEIETIFAEQ